jgi:hypothetical protein
MQHPVESSGFAPSTERALGQERRTVALAELITTLALALSTLVVATVISMGIARADAATAIIDHEGGVFVIALLLGLVFIGLGGVSVMTLPHNKRDR